VAPGETLQEWMVEHDMGVPEIALACRCTRMETILGVLDGSMPISPPLAGALQAGTGISAKFWLRLEERYRLGLARGKTAI
jgi:plasmid maintenance system antidote protein VapI